MPMGLIQRLFSQQATEEGDYGCRDAWILSDSAPLVVVLLSAGSDSVRTGFRTGARDRSSPASCAGMDSSWTQGRLPALVRPASCCSAEAIYWLYDHGGRHVPVKLWLQTDARWAFIQWSIERGDDCKNYFGSPQDALKGAAEHSREMLQQLLHVWRNLCTPESLNAVIEKGQFDATRWLYESRPAHYFANVRIHSKAFDSNSEAVQCIVFDVAWRDQATRLAWIDGAIHFAVCNGELELFYSLNSRRQ